MLFGSRWLDAGAVQLVVEARESAADVGLFDEQGRLSSEFAEVLADRFGLDTLTFEAPNKASQFAFMSLFGPDVRLSNVRIEELAARRDLSPRSSLRRFPAGEPHAAGRRSDRLMPQLEVVPARESTPYETVLADDPVVIVSDVIRATTTATTALARGNRCIPVSTVEAAWAAAATQNGATLLAGEQGGEPIPNFDLNNSPAAIDRVEGKTIILLSTSGTRVIHGALIASDVFVGCLRNAAATANAHRRDGSRCRLPRRLHARRVP